MATPTSLNRDANFVAVGGGVLDDGSKTIAPISIAAATGRLKVSAIISGAGAGSVNIVTDGTTTVTNPSTIDFTSGATVTNLGGGVAGVAVTGGSGTWFQDEIVAQNTTGTSFTLAHTPTAVVFLYKNGQYLISGSGKDYTRSGTALTLSISLNTTDILTATYS